jgi:hypothetical protein
MHNPIIMLFKPETEEPLAIMVSGLIIEMPTATVSAVTIATSDPKVLDVLRGGADKKPHENHAAACAILMRSASGPAI